jgi:hypothetical protein
MIEQRKEFQSLSDILEATFKTLNLAVDMTKAGRDGPPRLAPG